MIITWYGHSCFKIQTKPQRGVEEITVFIDPFDKKIGLKPPQGNANIVLVSHKHFDHNNTESLKGNPFVIDSPGEYSVKDILIEGIESFHDKSEGQEKGLNNIYVIKSEGMTLCHLGDLGHVLNEKQIDAIGEVDILMIPIGGKFTIDSKEAEKVIGQIEPKVIIPMHYKVDGSTADIDDEKVFAKEIGLEIEEKLKKFTFKPNDIKDFQNKVIFMDHTN